MPNHEEKNSLESLPLGFVGPWNTLQYVQKIRQLDTPLKDNKASIKSLGCNQKIYLPRKVIVCLFVLFGHPIEISQTTAPLVMFFDIIEKPLMSRGCTQLVWFHNASLYGGESREVIEYWKMFFIENQFKSKLRIIVEFEHALGIIGKLSMSGFNGDDLKNFQT